MRQSPLVFPVYAPSNLPPATRVRYRGGRLYVRDAAGNLEIENVNAKNESPIRPLTSVLELDVSTSAAATIGTTTAPHHSSSQTRGVYVWGVGGEDHIEPLPTVTGKGLQGDVQLVAVGRASSWAVVEGGTVLRWTNPQLGILPQPPSVFDGLPTNLVAISAGGHAAMALDDTGAVWTWGFGASGQLGRRVEDTRVESPPAQVEGLPEIAAISMGPVSALAAGVDGSLWQWGSAVGLRPHAPPRRVLPTAS